MTTMVGIAGYGPKLLLVASVLLVAGLSGCVGDSKGSDDPLGPDPTATTDGPDPTNTSLPDADDDGIDDANDTRPNTSDDPAYHYHDYWNNAQLIELWTGSVAVEAAESPNVHPTNGATFGTTEFGIPESCLVEVCTVYTGANLLELTLSWDASTIFGLKGYYHPATTPRFADLGEVTNGATIRIPIAKGEADLAHNTISRWAFRLEASVNETAPSVFPVRVAEGEVDVKIVIHNGGKLSIDPPHPDLWAGTRELDLGKTSLKSVDIVCIPQSPTGREDVTDFTLPQGSIVPVFTTTMRVEAWMNGTMDLPADGWELWYSTGGSTTKTKAAAVESTATHAVWEFPVNHQQEADSPYEEQSAWRFALNLTQTALTADPVDNLGSFKGDVDLVFRVFQEE